MPEENESEKVKSVTSEHVPAPEPEKKKKKTPFPAGWVALAVLLTLVIAGIGEFLVYHFLIEGKETENAPCENTCETVEVTDKETGETIKVVKVPVGNSDDDVAVRAMVDKLYNVAANFIYGGTGWTPNLVRTYDEAFIQYQPEGLKTETELTLSYGFEIVWDGSNKEFGGKEDQILDGGLNKALLEELTKNGYKEHGYAMMVGPEYINEEAGIICSMSYSGLPYSVGCGSVNWYSTDNWDLINELAEAYKKKTGKYPVLLRTSADKIKDSGYEKYQKVQASDANAMAEFYRVSPESEWVFFRGGQDAPDCSEYNTEDLKRAFVGDVCWNYATNERGTVKL